MKTFSYPNYDYHMPVKPARDISKWVQSARELYYQIHKGQERNQALSKIVDGWDVMEKLDFENWLKFYESGTQNKYKEAQVNYWGDQNNLGYYLPMPSERKPDMPTLKLDLNTISDPVQHPDLQQEERRKIIETQRQKILSRLNSAEKALSSPEGHMLLGDAELAGALDSLLQLKKKIHIVNKISTSVRLYQDMIIREANILAGRGFKHASDFMTKIAQAVPSVAEPENPAQIGGGQVGFVPGQTAGQVPLDNQPPIPISVDPQQQGAPPETPPTSTVEKNISPGMQEFLAGLDDTLEPLDKLEVDEGDVEDAIVSEAQAADPAGLPPEPVMEVEEPIQDPEVEAGKDFDQMFEHTFADLTVADVVTKLEDLAKIFKTREIPRQLSMADMMLNQLGLASMFPTIGEIIQKNLENTNYSLSRLEDISSRLRGAMTTKELDLGHDTTAVSPESAQVKTQLQETDEKEKARKKMRKELEEQKLEAPKPTPQVEMQQDLSQPATVAPAAPPVPPAPVR